jgi:hypothetical protein
MNKWLEKETDKSIIKVMVNKSGDYFKNLIKEPSLGKLTKKYFLNQFRILKSKMTYRPLAEFLRQVGNQLGFLSCLEKNQRESFFDIFLSKTIFPFNSRCDIRRNKNWKCICQGSMS